MGKWISQSTQEFAKAAEIGVAGVLLPLLLRDLTSLAAPAANGIGFFVAVIVVYWLPPPSRVGFVKWALASLIFAVVVFVFSKYV